MKKPVDPLTRRQNRIWAERHKRGEQIVGRLIVNSETGEFVQFDPIIIDKWGFAETPLKIEGTTSIPVFGLYLGGNE